MEASCSFVLSIALQRNKVHHAVQADGAGSVHHDFLPAAQRLTVEHYMGVLSLGCKQRVAQSTNTRTMSRTE